MCMKWIRENFSNTSETNKKSDANLDIDVDLDEKEPLLGKSKHFKIDDSQDFKKWYLQEFREELESDCFKSLIKSSE